MKTTHLARPHSLAYTKYSLVHAGAQSERFCFKLGFVKGVNGHKFGKR